ncbi:hypothetical protein CEXT_778571 [Caerostris extrusa]|uniref:Uncharacterized protein n=1 Tax=Caerostris extrusa TaxID=172846 RepID=A0AAV4V4G5_CAEEX|nr:hypothetical protein CEXT_778571 [Caerostris extrusa]
MSKETIKKTVGDRRFGRDNATITLSNKSVINVLISSGPPLIDVIPGFPLTLHPHGKHQSPQVLLKSTAKEANRASWPAVITTGRLKFPPDYHKL